MPSGSPKEIAYRIDEKTGCFICISHSRDTNGYPVMTRNGKSRHISRVMYEREYGAVSQKLFCLHECDNPACINPKHLFLGDYDSNMKDMVSKNLQSRWEKVWCAKLTRFDVIKIREDNRPNNIIAGDYGVDTSHICKIKHGLKWKGIENEVRHGEERHSTALHQ